MLQVLNPCIVYYRQRQLKWPLIPEKESKDSSVVIWKILMPLFYVYKVMYSAL